MAVLNNIRKHGIFLIIVIALALFAFILADVIRQGGFSPDQGGNAIGKVNEKEINYQDFSQRVQSAQQNAPQNVTTVQAVNQVWEGMIEQALIEEQIEKLGIDVGSRQITNALAQQFGQNPEFLTNGRFDVNKLKGYISQIRSTSPQAYQQWLMTEDQMVENSKANVYFDLLGAGLSVTTSEAKEIYKLDNTTFDVDYVRIPYSSIDDDKVNVSDKEIQDYIDKHKSKFNNQGARDIRYVLFEEKASSEDANAVKEELTKLLVDHETYNRAADIDETVAGFKNAKNYDEYLAENSDIPFENQFKYKSSLPQKYADTLFNLNKNEGFGPYKEDGYWKYSKLVDHRQIPDSVKVKHILISYRGLPTGQNIERTKPEAEKLADSILNVIKKDHDKFGDMSKEYSDDPSTKTDGGEIGWITYQEGQTNSFLDFAFENDPETSGVVETQYGFHVTYIEDNRNKQRAVKLATLAKQIEPSEKTSNDLFNKTTKFQLAAKDDDFAKEAKDKSYKVRTVKNLAPMDEHITGLNNHRNIVKWAFKDDTKAGDITRFDIDQGYIVVQMTSSTSKGKSTVEEASDQVKPILIKRKKGEYLKDKIKGNDLNKIASEFNSQKKSKSGLSLERPDIEGNEPSVAGTAFSMEKGEVSKPIAGHNAAYVIKLLKRNNAGKLDSYSSTVQKENQKIRQQAAERLLKSLRNKADIVDRRGQFY